MLATLQSKLDTAFQKIRGKSIVKAHDIEEALKEVRKALFDADVNFKVVKEFCDRISEKALGEAVLKSVSPSQQVIKIVHDELVMLMGEGAAEIDLKMRPPAVILLAGLQGAGKTTTAAKLARHLKEERKKKCLLVPADVYRPAAIEQLKTLGTSLGIDVFPSTSDDDPVRLAELALQYASLHNIDVIIIDTAGRFQVDTVLMDELVKIKAATQPIEILLVADAMTGQEAVNVAEGFHKALAITGLILTKLDGDARGGAALSMRAVTGVPIKFIGIGEKVDALEVFHPERLATRILGMGDVLTLIEKAEKAIDEDERKKLEKKLKKNDFTLDDFLSQLSMVKRMGSMSSLTSMIPGVGKLTEKINPDDMDREVKHIEAIIYSMTPKERANPAILNGSRRRRIALGSGMSVEKVNALLKQFQEMKKMMTMLAQGGLGGLMKMMGGKGGKGFPPGFPPFGK
jgi:signal recognition particle subunit SRP54